MQMAPYVQALQDDLANAAALAGGEASGSRAAARAGARVVAPAAAARPPERGRAVAQLTGSGRVEVRLAGREPELVYVEDEEAEPAPPPPTTRSPARITLRLSESLKAQIDLAAAREASPSTRGSCALARGLETRSVRAGRRLTGFAES